MAGEQAGIARSSSSSDLGPLGSANTTSTPGSSKHRDGDMIRQYYIAVDRAQSKMRTLLELLGFLGTRDGRPLIICCSSRDSLDAVFAAVEGSGKFAASFLHSDLDDGERALSLETFRLAISEWNYFNAERTAVEEAEMEPRKSLVLVMTDACLPSHALGESTISGLVVINYDLPVSKEAYSRRTVACLGAPLVGGMAGGSPSSGNRNPGGSSGGGGARGRRMVISMIVGGEVSALRCLEESSGVVIEEMPINISELV